MSKSSSKDTFFEPFYLEPYIEKLAYNNEKIGDKTVDGVVLVNTESIKNAFENKIEELTTLSDTVASEIYQTYNDFNNHQKDYKNNILTIESKMKAIQDEFIVMNTGVQHISHNIAGVAKQLEDCSVPSKRANEAIELISVINSFLEYNNEPSTFKDPENLNKSTIVMHSVVSIFEDLNDSRFDHARQAIYESYRRLINEVNQQFTLAYQKGDIQTMKECSNTLVSSNEFHTCYTTLINLCIHDFVFLSQDFPMGVLNTFNTGTNIIDQVFYGHKRLVMNNFVQQIFEVIIKKRVTTELEGLKPDQVRTFEVLKKLYQECCSIEKAILDSNTVVQASAMEMYKRAIFGQYLDTYIQDEVNQLKNYYRDTIISHTMVDLNYSKNIFSSIQLNSPKVDVANIISHNIAVSMIQDNRHAIERCEILSSTVDLPSNIVQIYMTLIDFLPRIYCTNGIEMALRALPPINPKQRPSLDFFKLIEQLNIILLFLQKHFSEMIMKTVGLTTHYTTCLGHLKTIKLCFESKIQEGLDRVLTSYINWIKYILSNEQKQNEFINCEGGVLGTKAMKSVCEAIDYFLNELADSLEGPNFETINTEFAMRFLKIYLDHMQNFTYTSEGAMLIGWDISEYSRRINRNNNDNIKQLFTVLDSLVDFLMLHPDNIKELMSNDDLKFVDRTLISNIIQCRTDFRESIIDRIFH